MVKSDLLDNLEQVSDWKIKKIQDLDAQIEQATQEEDKLQRDIKSLQERLLQSKEKKAKATEEKEKVAEEEKEHLWNGIAKGLEEATKLIGERNDIFSNLKKARANQIEQLLKQPKFQERVDEYEQFQATKHELEKLPKSYQDAILKHHEQVERDLAPIFRAFSEPLPSAKEQKRIFGFVASVSPSFENLQTIVIIIPVPFSTYKKPSISEDLNQVIAYRVFAAIYGALHRIGISKPTIRYDDY
jgi:chromosome segregation ATPase